MGLLSKSIILLLIFTQICFAADPSIRSPHQFMFGFEPTKTSLFMLWDSAMATLRKAITGKGKGVLEIEGPNNIRARENYLKLIREQCPECKIIEVRESHGTISYQISYPDDFYIRTSLDAGAMEWQTKPSTVTQLSDNMGRLQSDVFDLGRKAGANMHLNALGGHVTFSGFGGDTFWFGNYLKLRTHLTFLDRGFFGKDDYNAKPVLLWVQEQQEKYAKVHAEHDQQWKRFLQDLDNYLNTNASDEKLIALFENRKILSQKEYGDKLLEIYFNEDQEDAWTGKRSKPKYVAQKPGNGLIENRAIRPQKNAKQLLKLARFIESEAWFVKEQMNQGKELVFTPKDYEDLGKYEVSRLTKRTITDLGLDWNDYLEFTSTGDVELYGNEPTLKGHFKDNPFGALKRDELYQKVLNRFTKIQNLNERQAAFLAWFLNEMAYTVDAVEKNAAILAEKIKPAKLSAGSLDTVIRSSAELTRKFPANSKTIVQSLARFTSEAFDAAMITGKVKNISMLLELIPEAEADAFLKKLASHQGSKFNPNLLEVHAGLIEIKSRSSDVRLDIDQYMKIFSDNPISKTPSRLNALADLYGDKFDANHGSIYKKFSSHLKENPHFSIHEADIDVLRFMASRAPAEEEQLYKPLRRYLENAIRANEYGIKDYYKTIVNFEMLASVTPLKERAAFLTAFRKNVVLMDKVKNDPDSKSFIEKVDLALAETSQKACSHHMGSKYFTNIRKFLGL